jgi:hypothetical protein
MNIFPENQSPKKPVIVGARVLKTDKIKKLENKKAILENNVNYFWWSLWIYK